MNKNTYSTIENYMLKCMNDSAHDEQHIYRVLYAALEIANDYSVDNDVLITASLLHDIGRNAQINDSSLDHAIVGSSMAYDYLISIGWQNEKARHVKNCISTHRYRNHNEPQTIEAEILFDADKLDATGTLGIARTLLYKGTVAEPIYSVDEKGNIQYGIEDSVPSFFHEYNWKLSKLYDRFYTKLAKAIAEKRRQASIEFYQSIVQEVTETQNIGKQKLKELTAGKESI